MAVVKKGNREMTVEPHKVEGLVNQGWSEINEEGKTLREGKPTTAKDFAEKYANQLEKNKELLEENAALKEAIKALEDETTKEVSAAKQKLLDKCAELGIDTTDLNTKQLKEAIKAKQAE